MMQNISSVLKKRGGGIYRFPSRRAKATCMFCRWRKVRCDVEDSQRCSNCVLADVQCILVAGQRHRKRYTVSKPDESSLIPIPVMETASTNFRETTNQPEVVNTPRHSPRTTAKEQSKVSRIHCYHALSDQSVMANHSMQDLNNEVDWQEVAKQSCLSPVSPEALIGFPTSGTVFPKVGSPHPAIPDFVKPFPPCLAREDTDYLLRKGALTTPDPELRNELLRCYTIFVHPCLPIVDLEAFQASLEDPSLHGPVSFPLFQAIMFAGAAWVDIKQLRNLGFLTRMSARKAFYLKARLLYDLDYEEDQLCIVQTLLLLSFWWESPTGQKHAWHWSGVSLLVARNINLNHDISNQSLDPKLRVLRRKIWWSCVVRDTISSFASNRTPRLEENDFDIPMPTLDDFVIRESSFPVTRWATPDDLKLQEQLAPAFIGMCKITQILSKILHLAYHESPAGYTGTLYSNQELNASPPVKVKTHQEIQRLEMCEKDIRMWREEIPEEALHQTPMSNASLPHEQASLLHRAMLSMIYLTTILTLHRPHILSSSTTLAELSSMPETPECPTRTIRRAAGLTNMIIMDLYRADLTRLLPATGISCLIVVSITHVFDTKSSDEAVSLEGSRRLEECKLALRELRDGHVAAEWAINFLSFLASRMKPTQSSGRSKSGMVGGEIQWNFQTQVRSNNEIQDPLLSPRKSISLLNEHINSPLLNFDTAVRPQTLFAQLPEALSIQTPRYSSDPTSSPDHFSDLINFPEMWLDFGGSQDQGSNTDMMKNCDPLMAVGI